MSNIVISMSDDLYDDDFLDIAFSESRCSVNRHTKDGACIVSADSRVISTGHNSADSPHEPAEVAAILNTDDDLEGCTLYVTRFYPNYKTLRLIRDEGIARVVSHAPAIDAVPLLVEWIDEFLEEHGIVWTRVYTYMINANDLD